MSDDQDYQEWKNDPKAQEEHQLWRLKEEMKSSGLSLDTMLKVTEQFFKEQQK